MPQFINGWTVLVCSPKSFIWIYWNLITYVEVSFPSLPSSLHRFVWFDLFYFVSLVPSFFHHPTSIYDIHIEIITFHDEKLWMHSYLRLLPVIVKRMIHGNFIIVILVFIGFHYATNRVLADDWLFFAHFFFLAHN